MPSSGIGRVARARDELREFIAAVEQCADRGAPPTDGKCPPREQDARYVPDLDDGVMINAAALWPLLDPQWKEPREVVEGARHREGPEGLRLVPPGDAVLAGRGSTGSAQQDPSLGVAHGCFWRYHPVRAWTWELRLQDEIGPDFRIEEPPYLPGGRDLGDPGDGPHRDAFLLDHPRAALDAIEREATRRMGRGKGRRTVPEMRILEAGLWARHAADLWELELELAERQGAEIRILAPDEPEARAAFEAEHPERVDDRKRFLASPRPARRDVRRRGDERRCRYGRRRGWGGRRVTTAEAVPALVTTGLGGPVSAALEADLRSAGCGGTASSSGSTRPGTTPGSPSGCGRCAPPAPCRTRSTRSGAATSR